MKAPPNRRVVYLFGAGATQACINLVNSAHGTLMTQLAPALVAHLREAVASEPTFAKTESVLRLVNEVIDEDTDFEHVVTFLDECSSGLHRRFAETLRNTFETVLRTRLREISTEQGRIPNDLYAALIDFHLLPALGEVLHGFLTLNYDHYLEEAIAASDRYSVDGGVALSQSTHDKDPLRVLKLHGSFEWAATWPISPHDGAAASTLWIPPGIQKYKTRYPFNIIWGLARELLNCDVLRIVGCRLGPNDWDLVSLLFATRLTSSSGSGYEIEVIDTPRIAAEIRARHPYLGVKSILELERIGEQLVGEFGNRAPCTFASLSSEEQEQLVEHAHQQRPNWFLLWLKQRLETLVAGDGVISSPQGRLERLLAMD